MLLVVLAVVVVAVAVIDFTLGRRLISGLGRWDGDR